MRFCRHCDSILAECDPECPRCGHNPLFDEDRLCARRRRAARRTVLNEWLAYTGLDEWLELSGRKKGRTTLSATAFRLLLVRYALAALAAVLLVIGAIQPIIRITSLGAYNMLHLADLLAVLGHVATLEGPVFLFSYLGKATLAVAILAIVSALTRWDKGIAFAGMLSVCIMLLIIGGYYFSLGRISAGLSERLTSVFAAHGPEVITPALTGVLFLVLGTIVLNVAHCWNRRAYE